MFIISHQKRGSKKCKVIEIIFLHSKKCLLFFSLLKFMFHGLFVVVFFFYFFLSFFWHFVYHLTSEEMLQKKYKVIEIIFLKSKTYVLLFFSLFKFYVSCFCLWLVFFYLFFFHTFSYLFFYAFFLSSHIKRESPKNARSLK